jgi:hypothetical protein
VCDCCNGGADSWASAVKLMSRAALPPANDIECMEVSTFGFSD